MRSGLFYQKLVSSEGAVTHNVLKYQQLSIARYQVSFYGNSYFLVIIPKWPVPLMCILSHICECWSTLNLIIWLFLFVIITSTLEGHVRKCLCLRPWSLVGNLGVVSCFTSMNGYFYYIIIILPHIRQSVCMQIIIILKKRQAEQKNQKKNLNNYNIV